MTKNFCVDQLRPAWLRRTERGTLLCFSRRASSSFNEPSTCSRRERWVLSLCRLAAGSGLATEARRLSACFSPDREG